MCIIEKMLKLFFFAFLEISFFVCFLLVCCLAAFSGWPAVSLVKFLAFPVSTLVVSFYSIFSERRAVLSCFEL